MIYEQDVLMRMIHKVVWAVLRMVFRIETEDIDKLIEQENMRELMRLLDEGRIDEAENAVFMLTARRELPALKTAMLFYAALNAKTDEFLEANSFSREEVKMGLKDTLSQYGLDDLLEAFLDDG